MTVVSRRTLLALASVLGSWPGGAINGSAKDGTIGLIVELGDLLAKAAEAISRFGDSIAHLVTLGAQGYDAAAARKAQADLYALRVNLGGLVFGPNALLLLSINQYLQRASAAPKPSAEVLKMDWDAVVNKVNMATIQVDSLLEDVQKIRSDFILLDAYSTIQMALYGRESILARLYLLPPPVDEDELQALAKAGEEYQKLSLATQKASRQLATYISSLK
jgi:hypothetical protein